MMIEWSVQDKPGSFDCNPAMSLTATEAIRWQEKAKSKVQMWQEIARSGELARISIEVACINTPEFQRALEEIREYINQTEIERTIEEVSAERMSCFAQAVRRARL